MALLKISNDSDKRCVIVLKALPNKGNAFYGVTQNQ